MRRLRKWLPVVAAVVWFLIGFAVGGARSSNVAAPGGASPTLDQASAGVGEAVELPAADPTQVVDPKVDDARGREASESGAVAAAVSFLELTEEAVALSPGEAGELQRSISVSAEADRLAAEVEASMVDIAAAVPDGVVVSVAPLGASAVAVGDGWRVSVWYVGVIAYGPELVVEQWRTAVYTLEWQDGRWLMSDLVSLDGPTPVRPAATVASTPVEVLTVMSSWGDEGWGS